MQKQGSWLRWEGARSRTLTWNDIWRMEGQRISFLLKSVYDVLPSPVNLHTWGLKEDPNCTLCGRPANLEHVLSSCSVALADGRYTWRHNQVLRVIACTIDKARKEKPKVTGKLQFINFLKAGESKGATSQRCQGTLATAADWKLAADVGEQLTFPQEVAVTTRRPDIVLWSPATKQVVMVELTVPWEERIEEANERKRSKYQTLVEECQDNGWRAWCMLVEVGCHKFAGQSL